MAELWVVFYERGVSRKNFAHAGQIAAQVLKYFHVAGLATAEKQADGTWQISTTQITKEQLQAGLAAIAGRDEDGFTPEGRQTAIRKQQEELELQRRRPGFE